MLYSRKSAIMLGLVAITITGISAIGAEDPKKESFKNLKVLSKKKYSDEEMETVMTAFSRQLGVGCLYCHVPTKPGIVPKRVDFASDEKKEKLIARDMIRMTNKINRKYFKTNPDYLMVLPVVSCKTCHRGLTKPNDKIFHVR